MSLFGFVVRLAQWVVKAVYHYAENEGADELRDIADDMEAVGIDIPFYEPEQPPMSIQDLKADADREERQRAQWAAKHPDVTYQQEGNA